MLVLLWIALGAVPLLAQSTACSGTPAWSSCDLTFDLAAGENAATADVRAEFRSPHHRTYLLNAFAEGSRLTIRFAPTEEGDWDYRLTSNVARLNEQAGKFTAAASDSPGFVKAANVHHFATENDQPHLWMGSAVDNFLKLPRADFDRTVEQRAAEKFTHLRVTLDADADLREAADRIRAINARGLVVDLVLASIPDDAQTRRRYIAGIASRFAALNITWMGVPALEKLPHARAVLKDVGQLLKQYDPYNHPRTSMAEASSAPVSGDQWTTMRSYGTSDPNVGAVEQQLYATPAVNTGIRSSRDLWNATMNGQYPDSGSGASLSATTMTAWFDFMSANRHWELEPYFDLDGGRALALDGVEYVVYLEKPGPVEVTVEDHGYNVAWINPATGERIKAKDYKGTHFTGTPPDNTHDWVLHISRESEKGRMLKSYKFTSREEPIRLQTVEGNPEKTPFEVTSPEEGALPASGSVPGSVKVTRNSRATRTLLVEWTAEVTADGEGYRVVGAGNPASVEVPRSLAHSLPASVILRVYVLNALGKVYELDRVNRLLP